MTLFNTKRLRHLRKERENVALRLAMEWGYRMAETGKNLELARLEFERFLNL